MITNRTIWIQCMNFSVVGIYPRTATSKTNRDTVKGCMISFALSLTRSASRLRFAVGRGHYGDCTQSMCPSISRPFPILSRFKSVLCICPKAGRRRKSNTSVTIKCVDDFFQTRKAQNDNVPQIQKRAVFNRNFGFRRFVLGEVCGVSVALYWPGAEVSALLSSNSLPCGSARPYPFHKQRAFVSQHQREFAVRLVLIHLFTAPGKQSRCHTFLKINLVKSSEQVK